MSLVSLDMNSSPVACLLHQINESEAEIQNLSERSIDFLKKIQGQSKLVQFNYLSISYWKVIFLFIPLALSLIGLILTFHFKKLRILVLYNILTGTKATEASHIYCQTSDKVSDICKLQKKKIGQETKLIFNFHELRYQVIQGKPFALSLKVEEIQSYMTDRFFCRGLTSKEVLEQMQLFGKNQHTVKLPAFIQYTIAYLTHPFSLLAYFTCVIYWLLNYPMFSIILISTTMLTLCINFFLTRASYKKIKKMAENSIKVKVLRNGEFIEIDSSQMVPCDLYVPSDEVTCDSIVVKQDMFVSEVGYTGQNIPIGKFAPISFQKIMNTEHWIYEGCQIIIAKKQCLALAINTGYSSSKGKIIRKILHPKPANKQFFKSIMYLTLQIIVLSFILFFAVFHVMFENISDRSIILLKCGQFFSNSIPSVLVVYINFLHTFSLAKLNTKNIIGTQSQKIAQGSRLETICFDKTGTLTEKKVEFHSFIDLTTDATKPLTNEQLVTNEIVNMILSSCHSIKVLNGSLRGDQIDQAMFEKVQSQIIETNHQGVLWEIHTNHMKLEVLKINQFQSKHRSMSVLVRNSQNGQIYVFVKGAPETLHFHSLKKCQGFDHLLKNLSLKGYRTVAVSYKRINHCDLNDCLEWERQKYLQNTSILGLVTFNNRLKPDACWLIERVLEADLKIKMITGDNIYVSAQAALSLGFVKNESHILILQGHNIQLNNSIVAVSVSKVGDSIKEEDLYIENVDDFDYSQSFVALDADFMKKKEDFDQKCNVSIFARATPQIKTAIIRKEREKILTKHANQSLKQKIFGGLVLKVGMVGDGANDIMAIKEADIGIAINCSDAMHSADFTVLNLSKIELLLRECKCAQKNLIELTIISVTYYFLYNINSFIMTTDMAVYPAFGSLLKNFTMSYPLSLLIGLFPSSQKLSKYRPSINMLSLQSQIQLLGTMMIISAGTIVGYYYYKSSPDFEFNPDRSQFNYHNKSSTILTLINTFVIMNLNFSVVGSSPWKKPFWHNKWWLMLIIVNQIFNVVILLYSKWFTFLNYVQIDYKYGGIAYGIVAIFSVVLFAFNRFIYHLKLYKKQQKKNVILTCGPA